MKVKPLVWKQHHVKGNGFYGCTVTHAEIVYVYQPAFGLKRPRGIGTWGVFQYWGANKDRDGAFGRIRDKEGKPAYFKTATAAKRAAQAYWKRQVIALLHPAN